jgi:hypothetical protein
LIFVSERGAAVSRWRAVLLDFLERAGWSAGQVFFATLLAGGATISAASLPWRYASTLALSAGVASVVLTAVQYAARISNLPFWPDMLVRLVKTFLASLAASMAVRAFNITTFHWTTALNLAFITTLTALGKGLLAREPVAATPAGTAPGTVPAQAAPSAPARTSPSTLPIATYLHAVQR